MVNPSPNPIPDVFWARPFSQEEWAITPPSVQDHLLSLQKRLDQLAQQLEALQERLDKTSRTSNQPPSSDSPFQKPKRQPRRTGAPRGGRKGHPGRGPILLRPTDVHLIEPGPCACGHGELVSLTPYHTHQVIELPPIDLQVDHFILHQGTCSACGKPLKAQLPAAHDSGYGPRLSAWIAELTGM
jgi:transposase